MTAPHPFSTSAIRRGLCESFRNGGGMDTGVVANFARTTAG